MRWIEHAARLSEDEFDELRDEEMCCFNTYFSKQFPVCALCGGLHTMILRRFECGSIDCFEAAVKREMDKRSVNAIVNTNTGANGYTNFDADASARADSDAEGQEDGDHDLSNDNGGDSGWNGNEDSGGLEGNEEGGRRDGCDDARGWGEEGESGRLSAGDGTDGDVQYNEGGGVDKEAITVPKLGGRGSCCPVIWKVEHCTAFDYYCAEHNGEMHVRGHDQCSVRKPPQFTDVTKAFMQKEDKHGTAPRNIRMKMKMEYRKPCRGWATAKQIANALKYIRLKVCTKNSTAAVEKIVRQWFYARGINPKKVFVIGTSLDDDGYAHVGKGEEDDALHLGLTTVEMIENCAKYMCGDQPAMFHANATFKLSDLGYLVITCGVTDHARSYQLAAIFVVSHRTTLDYMRCFNALMATFLEIRARVPKISYVMGDAEDAQYNAIQNVPELGSATVLMCFFHVLCNVRKKIRHMNVELRKKVMMGIIEMHFSSDMHDYVATRDVFFASGAARGAWQRSQATLIRNGFLEGTGGGKLITRRRATR